MVSFVFVSICALTTLEVLGVALGTFQPSGWDISEHGTKGLICGVCVCVCVCVCVDEHSGGSRIDIRGRKPLGAKSNFQNEFTNLASAPLSRT